METIGKIRRRRLVTQDSISGIARDPGLSRNTVKKALRTGGEPFDHRRERRTARRLYEALEIKRITGSTQRLFCTHPYGSCGTSHVPSCQITIGVSRNRSGLSRAVPIDP